MQKYLVAVFFLFAPVFVLAASLSAPCVSVTRYLSAGSRGADVSSLQLYLISQNFLDRGLATGYFGLRTQAAVMAFQKNAGIVSAGSPSTTGYGAVGPKTRAALAKCETLVAPSIPIVPIQPVQPLPPAPVSPQSPNASAGVDIVPELLPEASPAYASIPANTKAMTLAAFKFRPDLEAINLDRAAFTLVSGSVSDLEKITLWAHAKEVNGILVADPSGPLLEVGSTIPTGTSFVVVLQKTLQLPKNEDTSLWVAGDVSPVGTAEPGQSGDLLQIGLDPANTRGTGKDSGRSQSINGSPTALGKRIFKSVPTFSYDTAPGIAANGANDLLVLTVSADKKGDITLGRLSFTIALTGAAAGSFTLSGPNGIVHSSATISPSGSTLSVPFDNSSNARDATIAAGTSKTFILRVNDLALSGSSGSISAALKTDASFSGMSALASLAAANVAWSPDSFGSPASPAALDWANGYGLPGCFITAGLGSDCASRALSK